MWFLIILEVNLSAVTARSLHFIYVFTFGSNVSLSISLYKVTRTHIHYFFHHYQKCFFRCHISNTIVLPFYPDRKSFRNFKESDGD